MKYPCYGGDVKVESMMEEFQERDCQCCKKKTPATHCVYVQIDYMRGNDDCYMVCSYHVGLVRRPHLLEKFLEHYRIANAKEIVYLKATDPTNEDAVSVAFQCNQLLAGKQLTIESKSCQLDAQDAE